jgi:hypothetical protein
MDVASRQDSIFRRYYTPQDFVDRFAQDPTDACDVLVPVLHTNELWEANLLSIFREVPVNRLLIGDAGCLDDSIEIAGRFPRIKVFDHRDYATLGFSLRKLIEAVETEWFIYLHSDVYLPDGWFDAMRPHQSEYDWFGCPFHQTAMVEYLNREAERPYAGSQMGRKAAFEPRLGTVDDDYVYRQEDFVFADIVERSGGRVGKVEDTIHYHQTMHKPSPWARRVTGIHIDVEVSAEERVRTWTMQTRGIIKYLDPISPWLIRDVEAGLRHLDELGMLDWDEFRAWVRDVNPAWLPYISRPSRWKRTVRATLGPVARRLLY